MSLYILSPNTEGYFCQETTDLPLDTHSVRETCSILPARDIGAGQDNKLDGCIIPRGNEHDVHLARLSDGTLYEWSEDYICDCCEPGEPDRCFWYGKVTSAQHLHNLLRGTYQQVDEA